MEDSPLLFDLTRLSRPARPLEVYYLVPDPLPPPASPWRTAAGFALVVAAGLGVGLALAAVLL